MLEQQHHHRTPYGVLLIVFFICSFISSNHACNKMDQDSLWSSFDIPSALLNWSSSDCCHWEGITCDEDGRVTHLLLPSKGIQGGIFPSLGNLTHLAHLHLSHNSLYSSIETKLFVSLNRLEILDLSYNLLFGELPLSLPSSYIRIVDLSSNRFKGAIPSLFLEYASNLSSLNASNNLLTGQIPSSICLYSSSAKLLDFSFNGFSGIIPPGLEKCSKLQVFRAGFNNLSGTLPSDIYDALALEEISLPSNKFSGSLSDNIVNLSNLTSLELYFNNLSGVLPLHIGNLSNLRLIILHFNNLQGSLPPSLMNCTNLIELNLGYNKLEGDISMLNFSKLTQLTKLDLLSNHFTGIFPRSLYSCKSLKALRLSSNGLYLGQIQPEILSLKSLSFLSLAQNRLTNVTGAMKILMRSKSLTVLMLPRNFLGEPIPVGDGMLVSGFQNLRVLGLSGCQFTGRIPVWLARLKKLEVLDLSTNRITGSIPPWLGTLPSLFAIRLNNNSLSGKFPKELCRLQALVVSQKVATQPGHGYFELPVYLQPTNVPVSALQFKFLSNIPRGILLRNNSLSGNVPIEIGQLQLLQKLDLSLNNLSSNIPDQISNLQSLERLDLSGNHLSGSIPASLSSLHFLSSFSVAYNNLQGQIPSGTQLQSFSATSFEGNPGLCGAPLPSKCESTTSRSSETKGMKLDIVDENGNGIEIPWFHISVALGFIVGFWGVCGPLALCRSWRCAYFLFLFNVKDKLMRW